MPKSPFNLSSDDLRKAAALQARIELLQSNLSRLLVSPGRTKPAPATKARRVVSEARRKRLSAIAKARWKKAKAAGKTSL